MSAPRTCRVCGCTMQSARTHQHRRRAKPSYYFCPNCTRTISPSGNILREGQIPKKPKVKKGRHPGLITPNDLKRARESFFKSVESLETAEGGRC